MMPFAMTARRPDTTDAPSGPRRVRTIAVIVHERASDLFQTSYGLRGVALAWREQGRTVHVVRGPRAFVPADVAILHVDLTVVPEPYLALAARYPICVNGSVADIGKRRVSGQLVARGDGYGGPVIVKTDRNCGGFPEARLAARRGPLARLEWTVANRLPARFSGRLRSARYPVFSSPDQVPAWAWRDERFVVERFRPERRGDRFALRRWTFLGDREFHTLTLSRQSIVKGGTIAGRETLGAVPEVLVAARRRLGFEYGKFDYGIADGEVVLYDVNRTPSDARLGPGEALERGRLIADGIDAVLATAAVGAGPEGERVEVS
jgi:hypothetical protein